MRRATLAAIAIVFGIVARPLAPDPGSLAAAAARSWIHPLTVTHVYYSFEVETEGLPRHMWKPPPRNIDVTYRDLETGRLRTERGVDSEWGLIFEDPQVSRGRIEAVARGGGYMWCVLEVGHADGSGWTVSEFGRHRCRVKRAF